MSYNYQESATLTTAASNLVIASDALLSSSPDYKIATLSGGAVYSGATVISGGTVTVGRNAALSNSIIGNGGTAFVSSSGKFYGNTIKSGGWVTWALNNNYPVFSKVTIEAGGTLYLGNGYIYGRNNSIAAGALGYNLSNTSASVNGVLYGVTQKGGAFNYYDIVFSNFVNNGGFTYMQSGCSILNGSAIKAGAGFGLGNSSYLYNANVTNGSVWIQAAGAVISLGGAATYIKQGAVYHCAAAGTTNHDTNLYASDGVLYGVTLKTTGNWLRNLTIVSGLTISAPVVSNTGILSIGQGGIAAAPVVSDGGSIEVRSGGTATGITATDGATVLLAIAPNTIAQGTKNGSAFNITGPSVDGFEANNGVWLVVSAGGTAGNLDVNAGASAIFSSGGRGSGVTVNDGGRATVSSGGNVSGLTVESGASVIMREATVSSLVVKNGGWMSAATAGVGYHGGITVEAGGWLGLRATTITGDINVKSGTLGGFAFVTSDSIDGVAYGMGQTAGAFHFRNAKLVNFTNSGACYTYLSSGTVISNGSAVVAQGGFAFCSSGYLYNAQVTNGWIWVHDAGAPVSLGGAETNITKGNWYHCNAGGSSSKDNDLYAENGVLHSATIKNNGSRWLRNLTVLEGLTISESVVSSGGSLTLVSGGSGNDIDVKGWGRLYVSSGGVATSAHGTGGLNVFEGGIISSATVNSTGSMTVFDGGVGSDVAVESGAKLYVSNGGAIKGLTVSTGQLNQMHATFSGTAEGSNISIYGDKTSGQYCVTVYNTAVLSKVYHSGGGLWVYGNGTVKELQLEAGETVFQDNSYASDVKVSGGALLYVRGNALVENLHMSGGHARFSAGTVRDATFEGTIGSLTIKNGFLIESAAFNNGAVMSVCSGGSLNSATVNSHAVILVSNGAEVTNVVLNVDDWDGRFKIYDGGHVSGVTMSGVSGGRNYLIMYDGSGVLEDVTTDKAGIYLASGGIIRNLTQKNGAGVILRGEHPFASGATVLGGTLYFQNGAKGQDIVVNGGGCNIHDDGYAVQIKGSGAKVSRMDVVKGTVNVSAGGKLFDARISGGTVNVKSTGTTYGVPLLSGATLTGGTVNVSNAALSSIKYNNGGKIFVNGGTVTDFDIEVPDQATGAQLNLSGGAIASGGRVNGKDKVGVVNLTGGAKLNEAYVSGGSVFLSGLAEITNVEQTGGAVILRGEDAYASGATVLGGDFYFQNGAKGDDITVAGGTLQAYDTNMTNPAGSAEVVNDVTMTAGRIAIGSGATINRIAATGGTITVAAGGIANDVTIDEDAGATVSGTLNVATSAWNVTASNGGIVNVASGATLVNAKTNAGAHVDFVRDENLATFQGNKTNIAANTLYYAGSANALGLSVVNGVMKNLGADGNYYRLAIGTGITAENATVNNGWRLSAFQDAVVSGGVVNGNGGAAVVVMRDSSYAAGVTLKGNGGAQSGLLNVWDNASTGDIIVSNGGVLRIQSEGVVASGTVVSTGGKLEFAVGAGKIEDTFLKTGANLTLLEGANTGEELTFDFRGTTGNQSATVNNLNLINADTHVSVIGTEIGADYTLGTTAATAGALTIDLGDYRIFEEKVTAGSQYSDAFLGRNLDFTDGKTLKTTAITVGVAAAAAKFSATTATALNDGGFAAKWNANTTYAGGNLTVADANLGGNVWLTLDGFDQSAANIYGAEGAFAHDVNMWLYDGEVKNLAGGAKLGGSVANVNILLSDANENGMTVTGALYAGGMGSVTGDVKTQVYGGTFAGNVFAGALCNYVANSTATSTGDITLTVDNGTFANNIYAGAAVKAGAATGVVHTAGDITVELAGGAATKDAFCVYGGGYATGTTANLVYEAEDVIIGVTGGEWGAYASGRGIFGGVYADKVAASVASVAISVTGGKLGNIYGGGWAQNGGSSIVGDVTVTVAGDAEVANVFGGGSYSSTSDGATEVGDVTILIAGGAIYGNVFAGGQGEHSTVGNVTVTFTGSNGYDCNVYGYGIQTSATSSSDRQLFFDDYTGTISGAVGGFDAIAFAGDTAATLSGAIDNGEWSFDYAGRTLGADAAMLTLDAGTFAGDTVSVDLSTAAQVSTGWSIAAGLTAANATFDVELSTGSAANLALGDALGSAYGVYEGWGFTLEDSTLKFKNLA